MCGCATVHYCSSACQRADWLARHRSSCTNAANRARMYKKLRADEIADEFPRPTYLEFHFIKCIAVDEVTRFLETENSVDGVTFLVEFEEQTDGRVHISTNPGVNRAKPGKTHLYARVSWAGSMGADIELASFDSIDKLKESAGSREIDGS
ncbi:uncharacterized protein SCHCODRAFT_0252504 [Schizophyllum commune H4-8]|uniref:MYND-type domain-containing protein n=1 Tax=Schizophyllum commune (strain H4-8 / FGSC 9210) TaxID=578458 RepID=D8QHC1_SCHCM|nr:uncharacterized protein SCHCODRAFT_0252504 [Schizophyllum commune H4-8]KAI5887118.1 hypothetical protein SCHCODRAFT_0252504 [Schizophyllum commune H4-8]